MEKKKDSYGSKAINDTQYIPQMNQSTKENYHLCNTDMETTEHLFYSHEIIQNLRGSLHHRFKSKSIDIDLFSV